VNDRSNEPLTTSYNFRGVDYTIRELSIEEFDDINEKATVKTTITVDGEEREIERVDGVIQSKLMIAACVTPKPPKPTGLRLYNGLRQKVNDLHFSEEPDLNKKNPDGTDKKKSEAKTEPGK
jgi:hypothetical protein